MPNIAEYYGKFVTDLLEKEKEKDQRRQTEKDLEEKRLEKMRE